MAYTRQALGIDINVQEIAKLGGSATQAIAKVIEDPALPEVSCQILQLNRLTEGKKVLVPCKRTVLTPAARKRGIGLSMALKPLRAAVWARQHPVLAIGMGVGVVGLIFAAGYAMGKGKSK